MQYGIYHEDAIYKFYEKEGKNVAFNSICVADMWMSLFNVPGFSK